MLPMFCSLQTKLQKQTQTENKFLSFFELMKLLIRFQLVVLFIQHINFYSFVIDVNKRDKVTTHQIPS